MIKSQNRIRNICAAVVSAGLFFVLSCNRISNAETVQNGVIDLSGVNLDKKAIPLSGSWEFFWMKIIDPRNSSQSDRLFISVPGSWNGYGLMDGVLPGQGFASYRTTIITREKRLVGFVLPEISGAYRLWVNGELLASSGVIGRTPLESVPSARRNTAYCYAEGNPLVVVLHISNFHHANGGIIRPILFGSSTAIHTWSSRTFSMNMLISGGLSLIAISFFIFYILRRNEKHLRVMALLCFTASIMTIINGNYFFDSQDSILSWYIHVRLRYILPIITSLLFVLSVEGILSEIKTSRTELLKKILFWTGAAIILFTIVVPTIISSSFTAGYAAFFFLCISYSLYFIIPAIKVSHSGAVLLCTGAAVLFTAASANILYPGSLIDTADITSLSILLYAVIQSILISSRYSHAFHDVEMLSRQLKANNTMIKKLNEQIEHKNKEMSQRLYTDRLTSLPNRQSLFVDIHAISYPSLLLIDIDAFKEVNDFYGNRIGDFVLKEVAANISKFINHENSHLYKLSVDEYAILIDDDIIDAKTLGYISNSLCQEINKRPIVHGKNEIYIRITIGAALGPNPEGKRTYEDIIVRADMALKHAKRTAKHYLLYDDSMEIIKEYEKNMHWARKLKIAVEADRIVPYYQPIINTETEEIDEFECLIRLIDDDGSVILPSFFLDIAKKCRLYLELTRIMINKAFATFENSKYSFSINLSKDDILDFETKEYIIGMLKMKRETAARVIFEILESQEIISYTEISEFITLVKTFGCRIAVDDFGSGYSNFEHIMRLNIDIIKIDASLIKNIHVDKNSLIIVKTISVFAKELGIKTVAEYVHCREVFDAIREIGIDYAQGYHLGEPKDGIS